jgi:hypothetical protein
MKILLSILMLATVGTVTAKADSVTITLDQPSQSAGPGQTIDFSGTITNTSGTTIFLNADDFNFVASGFSINDEFFNTVPISLAPSGQAGDSSGDIELFEVTLNTPFTGSYLPASGSYTLFGGTDGGAQDNLGTTGFSVSPVPEPSSIYLLLSGSLLALFPLTRKMLARTS